MTEFALQEALSAPGYQIESVLGSIETEDLNKLAETADEFFEVKPTKKKKPTKEEREAEKERARIAKAGLKGRRRIGDRFLTFEEYKLNDSLASEAALNDYLVLGKVQK